MDRWTWFFLALTVIGVVAIYSRTTGYGFTEWDDQGYIYENEDLGPISGDQVILQFRSLVMGNYHPLTMLSYALDIRLFGAEPGALHSTNLVLHLFNALLVFAFLRGLFGRSSLAAVAAALFALHPLRVESVAWLSDRKDLLMLLFGLLSLLAWLRWLRSSSTRWYVLSLLAFICACLSKGMAVSLAPSLFLIDTARQRRVFSWQALKEKLPFLIIALVVGAVAVYAQSDSKAVGEVQHFHFSRAIVAMANLPIYLAQQFVPIGIRAHYGYPLIVSGWPPWHYFVMAAAVPLTAWWWWRKRPHAIVLFAVLFFVLNIAPVLQFIPVGYAVRADRYTYLSGIGWGLLAGWIIHWAGERWRRQALVMTIAAGYAILLGGIAYQRVPVWSDAIAVWDDMLQGAPEAGYFHEARGTSLMKRNRLDEALASLNAAVKYGGMEREGTLFQRANLFIRMRRFQAAEKDLQRVVALKWDKKGAVPFLVYTQSQLGRCDDVIRNVAKYLGKVEGDTDLLNARAWCLFKQGRAAEAALDVEASMRIKADYSGIHFLAAYAHLAQGDSASACEELGKSRQWPLHNPLWQPIRDSLAVSLCN